MWLYPYQCVIGTSRRICIYVVMLRHLGDRRSAFNFGDPPPPPTRPAVEQRNARNATHGWSGRLTTTRTTYPTQTQAQVQDRWNSHQWHTCLISPARATQQPRKHYQGDTRCVNQAGERMCHTKQRSYSLVHFFYSIRRQGISSPHRHLHRRYPCQRSSQPWHRQCRRRAAAGTRSPRPS